MKRHELKYVFSKTQAAVIMSRLSSVMSFDPHSDEYGSYRIRSLYFDTYNYDCYQSSVSGNGQRRKYRIRLYNENTGYIRAEIKERSGELIEKRSAEIDTVFANKILSGEFPEFSDCEQDVLKEFYIATETLLLKPVCIVEYDRRVFVSEPGNVRISFDTAIAGSCDTEEFLSGAFSGLPLLPDDKVIMEVKYDLIFPGYIKKLLSTGELSRTSFSKYTAAVDTCGKLSVKNF